MRMRDFHGRMATFFEPFTTAKSTTSTAHLARPKLVPGRFA